MSGRVYVYPHSVRHTFDGGAFSPSHRGRCSETAIGWWFLSPGSGGKWGGVAVNLRCHELMPRSISSVSDFDRGPHVKLLTHCQFVSSCFRPVYPSPRTPPIQIPCGPGALVHPGVSVTLGKICFLDKGESTVSGMLTVLRPNLDYDLTMRMGRRTRKPTTVRRIGLGCRAHIPLVETIRRISLCTPGEFGTQSSRRARSLPTKTSGRPHQSRRRPSSLAVHSTHVFHTTVACATSFSYEWSFVTP